MCKFKYKKNLFFQDLQFYKQDHMGVYQKYLKPFLFLPYSVIFQIWKNGRKVKWPDIFRMDI